MTAILIKNRNITNVVSKVVKKLHFLNQTPEKLLLLLKRFKKDLHNKNITQIRNEHRIMDASSKL